jgi:hypothetical protein
LQGYHMPVSQAPMFPPMAQEVITTFLEKSITDSLGVPIVGFRIDFYSADEDTDHLIADIALRLYARRDKLPNQGVLYEMGTEDLRGDLREAFKELLYGLHVYSGNIPFSIGFENVIPWGHEKLKGSFKNSYISLHATRDFTLVTKEFLPSWVSGHKSELSGPTALIEDRRAFCSMVIPPVETAHEKIEQIANQPEMADLAAALYGHLMHQGMGPASELPLAEVNFSEIEEFTK